MMSFFKKNKYTELLVLEKKKKAHLMLRTEEMEISWEFS